LALARAIDSTAEAAVDPEGPLLHSQEFNQHLPAGGFRMNGRLFDKWFIALLVL
jgi:hypothetical protein